MKSASIAVQYDLAASLALGRLHSTVAVRRRLHAVRNATNMTLLHVEVIGPHYARSLRKWHLGDVPMRPTEPRAKRVPIATVHAAST